MARNLAILAALVFLAGLLVLVVNTLLFFRTTFPEATFPVAEFDANTPREVQIDDDEYRYVIYAVVDTHDTEPPEALATVLAADGAPIETQPTSGYADLIGRHYKRVARFSVDEPGPVTVTVESGPAEDFAVFRDIKDVLDRRSAGATPGWIVGFVLLAAAIALLVTAMLKSEKGLERRISGASR